MSPFTQTLFKWQELKVITLEWDMPFILVSILVCEALSKGNVTKHAINHPNSHHHYIHKMQTANIQEIGQKVIGVSQKFTKPN